MKPSLVELPKPNLGDDFYIVCASPVYAPGPGLNFTSLPPSREVREPVPNFIDGMLSLALIS